VLHVVAYLEKEFNISVTDDDLVPDNFETIDRIVSFVQRKSTAS
jgi:acyl carrier protein